MQTEVMRYYGLARPPVDLGFFETEHHAQLTHDLKTAITGGRLIALTSTIGSGKTVLTRRLREELERHAPEIWAAVAGAVPSEGGVLGEGFSTAPRLSFDYAVMERYDNVLVVEAPFDWDDVGTWQSLEQIHGQDQQGNTVVGQHLGIDTTRSIIHGSGDHLLVTVGMDNFIVVHTEDATLIAHRDNDEAIRQIVQHLKEKGLEKYL